MKVLLNNKAYAMQREQFNELINIARRKVYNGIIAVEKDGIVEMMKDEFTSNTKKKTQVRQYRNMGFKVYVS